MSKFFISILLLCSFTVMAQEQDSLPKQKKHSALRVGIDISRPINSIFNNDNKGLELVADYRLNKNLYIATEIGTNNVTDSEDYFNYTAKGQYAKLGVNYNVYNNWLDMNNEIFGGARVGYSTFSQTLNSYQVNQYGTYFNNPTIDAGTEFSSLNATWIELMAGIKVETFKNVYLGASVSLKRMISTKEPENFKNLYIPGFNRVFSNNSGVGFNYTISYQFPFKK